MRLEVTRKSDLAVRSLGVLAQSDVRLKGPDLATRVGATPAYLAQVMAPLVRIGWVRSEPGPTGGYSLLKSIDEISVLNVIEVLEGPTERDRCVLQDRPCEESGPCALHVPWRRALNQLLEELEGTSVSVALKP
ncbi:MAG: RrF2 family transcriptional regulator [Acidimicrobiales bacterium]